MVAKWVTMTCMTTKQKFECDNPEVAILRNGRYAYKAECPWKGKNDRTLTAWKFCSKADLQEYQASKSAKDETSSNGTGETDATDRVPPEAKGNGGALGALPADEAPSESRTAMTNATF